jgi:antirestriction protein ArdC
MRQANELGGHIRKGEEGTIIVFWKVEDRCTEDEAMTETEPDNLSRRRFVLRYYRVSNVEQSELPKRALEKLPKVETHEHDPIEAIERIIAGMPNPPAIEHAGTKAFYSRAENRITIPPRNLFISAEEYGAILLHELTHSTGAEKRFARESTTEAADFGSTAYSKEELIAEMGGAYLCAEAGISNAVIGNQAAYIGGCFKRLRDDSWLVILAAAQAQHATDYILGRGATA